MRLKYILDDYGNFAIFSEVNSHDDMAKGFYRKPVSAGFCHLLTECNDGKTEIKYRIQCYERSTSLNLNSRKEDGKIISDKINNQEY